MDLEKKEKVWCVTGNCIDSKTGEIVGGIWPSNINELSGRKQRKQIIKYKKGEKSCCRKTSVLKDNPFPKYEETTFVSEAVIWDKLNREYDQYCTNDVFRIYFQDEKDSLSSGKEYNLNRKHTFYYLSLFYLNECFDEIFFNKDVFWALFHISRCAIITKRRYKKVMKELNSKLKRFLVTLGYPLSYLFVKVYYK